MAEATGHPAADGWEMLGAHVAFALGERTDFKWVCTDGGPPIQLQTAADERRLRIEPYRASGRERLRITAELPRPWFLVGGSEPAPAISVDAARGTDALVEAITNRLLPAAGPWYETARDRYRQSVADRDARLDLARAIAAAIGGHITCDEGRITTVGTDQRSPYHRGLITVQGDGSTVHVELSGLTGRQVLAMLTDLTEHN